MVPAHSASDSTHPARISNHDHMTYSEAWVTYISLTDAELDGIVDSLQYELGACDDLDPGSAEVASLVIVQRLRAAREVAAQRLGRIRTGMAPNPARDDDWRALASEVRDRADIVKIFIEHGYPLARHGREFHGPCPACGGRDRLLVTPGPPGRHWCRRQCGTRGDAITALRSLRPGLGFRDAVVELASGLGLPTPIIDLGRVAGRSHGDRSGHRDRNDLGPVRIRGGGRSRR